jgi:hypothetical protein
MDVPTVRAMVLEPENEPGFARIVLARVAAGSPIPRMDC